jgi:hypothetical protein
LASSLGQRYIRFPTSGKYEAMEDAYVDVPRFMQALKAELGLAASADRPSQPVSYETQKPDNLSRAQVIHSIFRTFLGRDPDPAGLSTGVRLLSGGGSLDDVFRWCLGSDEFGARYRQFLRDYVRPELLAPSDHTDDLLP